MFLHCEHREEVCMEQPLRYVAKWECGLVYLSSISLYRSIGLSNLKAGLGRFNRVQRILGLQRCVVDPLVKIWLYGGQYQRLHE